MTDANGQPMTRLAGWGRGGDTVRSDLAGLLLKWLLAGLVVVSWLHRAHTARVTNRPLSGVS
jgi:hypothetical protein